MVDDGPARPTGRTWPAIVTLYLLAALIPETLATSNTPVAAYLRSPVTLLFLAAFYGGADVAIRELRIRRRLGWPGTLLLAVAFGFANEGVVAATWYRVAPTGYAYLGGVDVAWAVLLTVFHAVFSVVIPIALVQVLFPRIADRRWVGRPGFGLAAGLPILLSLATLLTPAYRPQRLFVLGLIAVLILLALRTRPFDPAPTPSPTVAPSMTGAPSQTVAPSTGRLRWAGIGATVLFFGIGYLGPGIAASVAPHHLAALQPLYVLAMLALATAGTVVGRRWTRRSDWGPAQTLAVITGLLLPAVFLASANPAGFAGGAILASVPFVVLLVWLARRTRSDRAGRDLEDRGVGETWPGQRMRGPF